MLLQPTIERLRELRLLGMATALEEQTLMPDLQSVSFEDRLGLLVEREHTQRENRRLTRLLQLAKLRLPATVEDIDFRRPRGLDKSLILRLASSRWIESHEVVLVSGATGTGKSYLACALGHSACRHGLATRYYRFSRMLSELARARADGSYPKLLEKLARTQLLLIDDFGMSPLTETERRDLLEVLEDRYNRRATLVTSQLPFEHWHAAVGETTFADAILDRLAHGAHRITLKGASMRRKQNSSDEKTEDRG
ncbi:MAG: IS21-like element helper ATPase IstB [Gemmatimonadota bacterium]